MVAFYARFVFEPIKPASEIRDASRVLLEGPFEACQHATDILHFSGRGMKRGTSRTFTIHSAGRSSFLCWPIKRSGVGGTVARCRHSGFLFFFSFYLFLFSRHF